MKKVFASFLAGVWISCQLFAQVAVSGKSRQEFDSPMSFEVPMKDFLAMAEGKTWLTDEMAQFYCRGISFKYLVLKQVPSKDPTQVEVQGRITAANTGNKDQLIHLDFLLVGDGLTLPLTEIPRWSLETDEGKFRKIEFHFPRKLIEGSDALRLRIVANIRND